MVYVQRGNEPSPIRQDLDRAMRNAERRSRNPFRLGAAMGQRDGVEVAEYLYREGELLVEEADLAEVLEALSDLGVPEPQVTESPVEGLYVLLVDTNNIPELVDRLAARLGNDRAATPNYVADTQGFPRACPATEPLPWRGAPWPQLPEPEGPGSATVAIIDTGFLKGYESDSRFPWLAGITRYENDDDAYDANSTILPYGGHGTFATGVARCIAGAQADMLVRDCLLGGVIDEVTIIADLLHVLSEGAQVVSIQAGIYTRGHHPPKAFEVFARKYLKRYPDVVFVAAAGNEGYDAPFWPAAFDWTISVGALAFGANTRAPWSNYGYWVDVYAPGEGIANAYCVGEYEYLDGTRAEFRSGLAKWSGTSFATPFVAGLIARRMIERGIGAKQAAEVVMREARVNALSDVGPRLHP